MKLKNIEESKAYFDAKEKPINGQLQLKGTDICMDFHCECGTHSHYDGYFMHSVKCTGCGKVYALNPTIEMVELTHEDRFTGSH